MQTCFQLRKDFMLTFFAQSLIKPMYYKIKISEIKYILLLKWKRKLKQSEHHHMDYGHMKANSLQPKFKSHPQINIWDVDVMA